MVNIELVSKPNSDFMGYWIPSEKKDNVYLNVPKLWDWAVESSEPIAAQEEIIDRMEMKLTGVVLQEIVCIQKHKDKLRIKGGMCKPFCRHEKIVDAMLYPDEWEEIREFHRQKRIRYLEED